MNLDWIELGWVYQHIGSRVTCDPVPSHADYDFLILERDNNVCLHLESNGFIQDGSPKFHDGPYASLIKSYRREDINAIVTANSQFYYRFLDCTELARRFNLLQKSDRIALFRTILYGQDRHQIASLYHPIKEPANAPKP